MTNGTSMACDNAFQGRLSMQASERVTVAIMNISLSPFTVIVNLLLIYGLRRTREKQRSRTNELIYFICVSDFLLGLIKEPWLTALLLAYSSHEHCYLSICLQAVGETLAHLSGYLNLSLAIDRIVQIKQIEGQGWISTSCKARHFLLTALSISVSFSFLYTVGSLVVYYHEIHFAITCFDSVCVTAVLCCYLYTLYNSYKLLKAMQRSMTYSRRKVVLYQATITKTITLIIFVVCLCYTPYIIASFLWFSAVLEYGKSSAFVDRFIIWSYFFADLTSALNTLIYSFRNKKIRKFFRGLVFRRRNQGRVHPGFGTERIPIRVENKNRFISNVVQRIAWIKRDPN